MKSRLWVALFALMLLFAAPGIARAEVLLSPSAESPITGTGLGGLVRSADLNGDGLDDLAIGSIQASNGGIFIRLANADGTWTSKSTIAAGTGVGEFLFSELTGDDHLDLLVNFPNPDNSLTSSGTFRVYTGNGDGTFNPGQTLTLPGDKVVAVVPTGQAMKIEDINGDSKPDLWLALLGGQIGIAQGFGDGTFSAVSASVFPGAPGGPDQGFGTISSGDFNGDGRVDFVLGQIGKIFGTSSESDSGFYLLSGNSDSGGGFETPLKVPIPAPYGVIRQLLTSDLDGDGLDDLIVHSDTEGANEPRFLVYHGSNAGFAAPVTQAFSPTDRTPILVGDDFSSDGNLDLAWVEQPAVSSPPQTNRLKLATGTSNGSFSVQPGFFDLNFATSQSYATSSAAGDFNGDDAPDLATVFASSDCSVEACGTGIMLNSPILTPSQTNFDFGTTEESATPLTQTLTIGNSGSAPAKLIRAISSGNEPMRFTLSDGCDSISPGSSCSLTVTFDHSTSGTWTGDVELTFEGASEPVHLTMTGTVTKPVVTPLTYKAGLKLSGPKKVKAGKKFKISARTTNTGTGELGGVTLKWKALQGRAARSQGQLKLATIATGKSLTKSINVAIPRKKLVKGKPVQVTVTLIRQGKTLRTEKFNVRQEFGPQKSDRR